MDLRYGEKYEAFRAELRDFLRGWPLSGAEAELPLEQQEALFRQRGIERGYVYRHIPTEYGGAGGEPDVIIDQIVQEEYAAAGAPGALLTQGAGMLAPTLLELGTEEQKQRFMRRALTGEDIWCQGYSEPGAGSDLAALASRAELDGDEWVIHGHKVWTSGAEKADYMFGLFRTEPDASKHAGISYLLLDMKQPGIEVRPLREMTGGALFNEVTFDGARTPADWIVGERGQGWQVSRATLKHERNMIGNPNAMRRLFDELCEMLRSRRRDGRPALEHPVVRQRLAEIEGYLLSHEYTGRRALTSTARGDFEDLALPTLMMKLYGTDLRRRISETAFDWIGADALVEPTEEEQRPLAARTPGAWSARMMGALAVAIAGGASNIQRNVIGERGLGLPRDLRSQKARADG
jgi:alkylation response protein AidB-like acyl-CoA dehydrogenase